MIQEKKQGNVVAIIMMIFLFGMISFITNLASPMGDVLKYYFKSQLIEIPNWMGTLGVFANFIAYAVMGIPGGIILQKKGYKITALIAIAIGFVGVGIQTVSGLIPGIAAFGVYVTGAFVAGFSMCMLNMVVNPMLNNLGGGGNSGNQLIQIGGTFNSLCGTAVIVVVGVLVGNIAKAEISDVFPVMYIALAIFALAFLVIALATIPEPNRGKKIEEEKSQYSPLSFRHFILGAFGIFVYVGVEVGIPNVLQKFLQNVDLNVLQLTAEQAATIEEKKAIIGEQAATIAGFVTGTYWFLMLIGRLVGAAIASKVSAKAMLTVVAGIGLLLVLGAMIAGSGNLVDLPTLQRSAEGSLSFGIVKVPLCAALLVLCGLCTSVMWGGIFNLAVEGLGKYTEKASGYFMVMVCGGGILPLLQNAIVDMTGGTGYLVSYWVVVAGLAYMLYFAFVGSRNVNKDIPVA
ncbi:MAG: MFS transporter [Prevotellaceae bacterium]|jgi:FHS family L-fucose permease-like MFS transporter|nr:MFS transporter [Prevotellaceae bacterium]